MNAIKYSVQTIEDGTTQGFRSVVSSATSTLFDFLKLFFKTMLDHEGVA